MQCAYGRESGSFTCLTDKELKTVAKSLNIPTTKKSKKELYEAIKQKSNSKNEVELIESNSELTKKSILKPGTPGFYLSNEDIDTIMHQYENAHPSFTSFGAVPYDFDETPTGGWYENCVGLDEMEAEDMKNRQWGFVINLDPSIKQGSHWVCVFVTNKNNKNSRSSILIRLVLRNADPW